MPFLMTNGLRVHYVDRGAGRPLLLVHGFPLDHSMWAGQVERLSRSWRVIAPDLRGFGLSAGTPGKVTMGQYADDLSELLNALSISEPAVFCGLSMGGYIGWDFWRRHADQLAALILCDTRAAADSPEQARGRRIAADQVLSQGAQQLVDDMAARLFAPETVQEHPELVASTRQVMLQTAPVAIAAALWGMAERTDFTAELPRISVPTLVVCGEHDVISPPDEMRGIAAAIPGSQCAIIPRAGHMAPLEQPAAVHSAIARFLAGESG